MICGICGFHDFLGKRTVWQEIYNDRPKLPKMYPLYDTNSSNKSEKSSNNSSHVKENNTRHDPQLRKNTHYMTYVDLTGHHVRENWFIFDEIHYVQTRYDRHVIIPLYHYTEKAAFYVTIFPLYKLRGLQMPSNEAKLFDRFSAIDKQLLNVVTMRGPYGTEHYHLWLNGCFVLDRWYL